MKIEFYTGFIKNYNKRFGKNKKIKIRFIERTKLFQNDHRNPLLKNHPLKGKKLNQRAFSVTGDIRVIYQIVNGTIYFVDIGTHNQVY
ncbi:MAG: type II toxin-antitoxin system mRNA interferase toxin, RelE/StbE family [Patescibacteria group bacterium]